MRVWVRSWEARGWQVCIKEKGRAPCKNVSIRVINFSFRPGQRWPKRIVRYRFPGWQKAPLVRFASEDEVLSCGRPLC